VEKKLTKLLDSKTEMDNFILAMPKLHFMEMIY